MLQRVGVERLKAARLCTGGRWNTSYLRGTIQKQCNIGAK